MLARFLLTLGFFGVVFSLPAQNLDARLSDIGERLESAEAVLAKGKAANLTELSDLAEELETLLAEMRQMEREVGRELDGLEAQFYDEGEELMRLIGFITTFEAQPAPDYILHPEGAVASVQANIIVSSLLEELEGQVSTVAKRLQAWREVKSNEEALAQSTNSAFEQVNILRENIVLADRGERGTREVEKPELLAALEDVAVDLDQFVGGLSQLDLAQVSGNGASAFSMEAQKGALDFPVSGVPIRVREGVEIQTEDNFVISPIPGTVRFQNAFQDYGQMIIIEPEPDFLLVLAGFDAALVSEGDVIEAGDVIGVYNEGTAQSSASSQSQETESLRLPKKRLYVETRTNTAPVNAMEYFRVKEN